MRHEDRHSGGIVGGNQFRSNHWNFQPFSADRGYGLGEIDRGTLRQNVPATTNRHVYSSEAGPLGALRQLGPG